MAAESSRSSSSSADSYIGSLISLTSKSEIRYEGILYNINTEESSIGLRNVRSFGTEGRKKDGPQLMPSDKVYEYILFRGSDIKDLQVKSSLPVQQPTQQINSDPAIIQSHYPRPPPTSSSLPAAAASNPLPDPSIPNPQLGHPGSNMQGVLPLYQPGGNWGPMPPPPNANSSGGLAMPPMYWPGFYAPPPNGMPQLHQQSLLRPPHGLSGYPGYNPSLPSGPPSLPTSNMPEYPPSHMSSANNTTSTPLLGSTLPSSLPPGPPPSVSATDTLPSLMQNMPPLNSVVPSAPPIGSMQSSSLLNTADVNVTASVPSESHLRYPGMPYPISSVAGTNAAVSAESPMPSLVTPGQLLQSGQNPVVSSQFTQTVHKDVEVVQAPTPSSEPSAPPVPTEAQPPILPLPPQSRILPKTNGASYQNRQSYNYRGRERGRGSGVQGSRQVMKFTEEFDFNAMNEKFNKDEIWGSLGKGNKSSPKENEGNASDEDEYEDENDADVPKVDTKPVYSKDDFFDTLSCNSLGNQSNNGRTRFSEQMKLDTETFGEFSRYRGGRGYRGGRSRGGYYGRGGGGGYNSYGGGRGRGGRGPNPTRDY